MKNSSVFRIVVVFDVNWGEQPSTQLESNVQRTSAQKLG
ncbi:hypothetical protein PJE062_626 [Pseudovibrio sp. JE062]|nr:hypothetical protein PJE062_626 [Pseudovibrio sp. JE062]